MSSNVEWKEGYEAIGSTHVFAILMIVWTDIEVIWLRFTDHQQHLPLVLPDTTHYTFIEVPEEVISWDCDY